MVEYLKTFDLVLTLWKERLIPVKYPLTERHAQWHRNSHIKTHTYIHIYIQINE